MPSPSPCIVIPVHNRRDITLRCLENLARTGVLEWARALVVDDGSTDGTAEAIRRDFPGVEILPGDGSLWWTGGIERGMRAAMAAGAEFIIWLNDDCRPEAGTLEGLIAVSRERGGITVAQACTASGYMYGGARLGRWTIERIPCGRDEILPCDTLTGNCVVLPRAAVEKTGYPDARRLPHVLADADYGLRAHRLGVPIWVVGAHLCQNEDNLKNHMLSWLLSGVPLPRLWRDVLAKRSALHPGTAWTFYTRHFGFGRGGAIIAWGYGRLVLISLARLLLPRRCIEWVYARRSAAWQTQRFYEGRESAHLRSADPLPPP